MGRCTNSTAHSCPAVFAGILMPLVIAGLAQAAGASRDSNVLYVPIPSDVSEQQVSRADEPLKARLHGLVIQELQRKQSLAAQAAPADVIVILTHPDGEPIQPDLAAASAAAADHATPLPDPSANDLTFTFDSPDDPWSASDLLDLTNAFNAFYPTAKTIYGSPAFNITVNVRQDPDSPFVGVYNASLNEITLANASDLTVPCHEMIHAFRDDDILLLSTYEEGMTRAAEVEVFARLAPKYTHSFDQNHSYTYDVYYEALNRPAIGSQGGNFSQGYVSDLLRYQLTGYAWAKGLIENPRFLADFNASVYANALTDPTTLFTESKLLGLAAAAQPSVEGKPFRTWYGEQGAFDTNPPKGYLLYQRINQFDVDYFVRDMSGRETMQPNATIQWFVFDSRDVLLGTGSDVTLPNGFVDLIQPAATAIGDYAGRIRLVARATGPNGTIIDTAMRSAGAASGVFGVVGGDVDAGIVTITPLDELTPPLGVTVMNGAFAAPSLGRVRGQLLAVFSDMSGRPLFSRQFTKDASDYFVLMDPTSPTSTTTTTTTTSSTTTQSTSSTTTVPTTTTARPTTTTTIPAACEVVLTFTSIDCRLAALIAKVSTAPDVGGVRTILLHQLNQAKDRNELAETLFEGGRTTNGRSALRHAIRHMSQFVYRVSTLRRRRQIGAARREMFSKEGKSILEDMQSLLRTGTQPRGEQQDAGSSVRRE